MITEISLVTPTGNRWTIKYDYDDPDRLADIYFNDNGLDCLEVRHYDYHTGKFTQPPPSEELLARKLVAYVLDNNLLYYW